MSKNYFEVSTRSPFRAEFWYFDTQDYKADDIFAEMGVVPKFYQHMGREGSNYLIIRCRVLRRDVHRFEKAMERLRQKMLLTGNPDYDEFCDEIMGLFEIDELTFYTKLEILTAYARDLETNHPGIFSELKEKYGDYDP